MPTFSGHQIANVFTIEFHVCYITPAFIQIKSYMNYLVEQNVSDLQHVSI